MLLNQKRTTFLSVMQVSPSRAGASGQAYVDIEKGGPKAAVSLGAELEKGSGGMQRLSFLNYGYE
jgi:hypothetical protein